MTQVYLCRIKVLGFPFVVLTFEEAERWREEDPETHVYDAIPVKNL